MATFNDGSGLISFEKIGAPTKLPEPPRPTAWIIERPGRLPTMIHYAGCAEKAQAMGYVVTPYYSKVPA